MTKQKVTKRGSSWVEIKLHTELESRREVERELEIKKRSREEIELENWRR